ncbi:MAG: 16S rRNA (guanine(527)-N(7))-methyltransferase RsmG [Clostridia bacterium]|nr:16S rRNA (guanine(527)-N(7))-methyltransferase RsmG [Clostridia bacterium]
MEQTILEKLNEITGEKREMFSAYRALILEYNERYNLTTILEEQDMLYKHFLDSAVGESLFKRNAKVIEIGSGAGFPSIPLKILRDDLSFTLVESVGKKCEFLHAVVDKLSLSKMNIYSKRAEDLAKDSEMRERFDHATARAVARMNTLSEYCLPFVKLGGSFIAYKSAETEEINEAETAYKILGGRLKTVISYELPQSYGGRTLAVVEKVKPTPKKYPRGQGKERKSPL